MAGTHRCPRCGKMFETQEEMYHHFENDHIAKENEELKQMEKKEKEMSNRKDVLLGKKDGLNKKVDSKKSKEEAAAAATKGALMAATGWGLVINILLKLAKFGVYAAISIVVLLVVLDNLNNMIYYTLPEISDMIKFL